MAHSDAAAIEQLFAFNPKVRIIWAHPGMGESEAVVRRVFGNISLWWESSPSFGHPRGNHVSGMARAVPALPGAIRVRVDTWVTSRWPEVPALAEAARGWLADLPRAVAENIAFRNGERLFAP